MEQLPPTLQQFQRLIRWNLLWFGLLVLTLLTFVASREIANLQERTRELRINWVSDGGLAISSAAGDGPFLVTHLVSDGAMEGEKVVATLPEPLIIVDSEGGTLVPPEAIKKLVWRSAITQESAFAPEGRTVNALFYRLEKTKKTDGVYKATSSP